MADSEAKSIAEEAGAIAEIKYECKFASQLKDEAGVFHLLTTFQI
jgi:hypothetical protein